MIDLNPSVLIGSQYYVNTEDTPEQVRAGIGKMAESGLKLVRIFLQWTHVEPRQGGWDWSQYDALFEAAREGGLGVIVTLTALHPPGWMRISFGPQDQGPFDDPAYWDQAKGYIQQVVERYKDHPALHSWILTNEPQLSLNQDESVLKQFQGFLSQRFNGDIEALNRLSFQQYDSFDQVQFGMGTKGGFSGYVYRLNWLNFMSTRLQEILAKIMAVIRESDEAHPIHVNPHGLVADMYPQGQSIWAEGRLVDFMGCSAHPSWHSTRFLHDRLHQSVALFADLMRGATRAPHKYFWVTELQGGTNIYSGMTYLGPSGEDLRSWVWESVGAGAKAVVFWCFNTRTQGFEAGEWGLVDQQGRVSPRLREVFAIASLLDKHQAVFSASKPGRAQVAVLFSEATWKLGNVEGQGYEPENPRNALMAADALAGAWMACSDAGLSVDFLDEIDLQNGIAHDYPVLILPGCTALEDASLAPIRTYVENGGTLLADALCGYKNPDGWLRDVAQNPLNDVFHASVADIQAVPEYKISQTSGKLNLPIWFLTVVLEPDNLADSLASFQDSDQYSALTFSKTGKGSAIRIGTVFFQRYFSHPTPDAFTEILKLISVSKIEEPMKLLNPGAWLRLRRLELPGGDLWILLNSGEGTTARLKAAPGIGLVRLTREGEEAVEWNGSLLEFRVPGQDALVLRSFPTK